MIDRGLSLQRAYYLACERYGEIGVDVERALTGWRRSRSRSTAGRGTTSAGSKAAGEALGGGLAVTGNYPGKARTPDELRSDLEKAYSLIPGRHRLNLHASYAETGGKTVERDEVRPEHFRGWIDWAKAPRARDRLQPDLLLAPQGRRRLHPVAPRRGDPPVLGRSRDRLPADRRGDRRGARLALRHQHLDSRRLEGHARRPQGASRAAGERRSTRSSPSRSTRASTATRSRPSCSAWGRSRTWSARTSSTSATP